MQPDDGSLPETKQRDDIVQTRRPGYLSLELEMVEYRLRDSVALLSDWSWGIKVSLSISQPRIGHDGRVCACVEAFQVDWR